MLERSNWARKLILAAAIAGSSAWGSTITGNLSDPGGIMAMVAESSDLQYADGSAYSSEPVLLLCVDISTEVPDGPTVFTAQSSGAAFPGGSGNAGVAALHWLFDTFYELYFKNGSAPTQWAFQYAVWEIGNDYAGTVDSIDPDQDTVLIESNGYYDDPIKPGYEEFHAAVRAMYDGLKAAVAELSPSYRSTRYTLDLLINHDAEFQNMVAIAEAPQVINPPPKPPQVEPHPVPAEMPLALMSLLIPGVALYARRTRRNKRQDQA